MNFKINYTQNMNIQNLINHNLLYKLQKKLIKIKIKKVKI